MLSARHFHIAVGAIGYRRADFCNQVTLVVCVARRLNQLTLEELVSVKAKRGSLALSSSAEKASPFTGLTAHLNFGPLDKEANWVGAIKARQVIDGASYGPEITSGELFRIRSGIVDQKCAPPRNR